MSPRRRHEHRRLCLGGSRAPESRARAGSDPGPTSLSVASDPACRSDREERYAIDSKKFIAEKPNIGIIRCSTRIQGLAPGRARLHTWSDLGLDLRTPTDVADTRPHYTNFAYMHRMCNRGRPPHRRRAGECNPFPAIISISTVFESARFADRTTRPSTVESAQKIV